ncbi:MAG: PaaI family thioesterase [Geodermatophilaceae bacterium]|nr:PaaI family thioesterase [Geodermatophilaceae bacterium]
MSTDWGQPRSKTVTWYDPVAAAASAAAMSGREHLQAIAAGTMPPPPIAALMDMTLVEVGEGTVQFRCTPGESAYNPIGMVHGGFVATVLDTVTGCAVQTTLEAGLAYTSLEIKVSYLRPVHTGAGDLIANERTLRRGRRAAFAEGEVRDAEGRLVATASSTLLVFPR